MPNVLECNDLLYAIDVTKPTQENMDGRSLPVGLYTTL